MGRQVHSQSRLAPDHRDALARTTDPPSLATTARITLLRQIQMVYVVELSAAPSPEWRRRFLRPPPVLVTAQYTGAGPLGARWVSRYLRRIPARLHACLRRIDPWISDANSIVEGDHRTRSRTPGSVQPHQTAISSSVRDVGARRVDTVKLRPSASNRVHRCCRWCEWRCGHVAREACPYLRAEGVPLPVPFESAPSRSRFPRIPGRPTPVALG